MAERPSGERAPDRRVPEWFALTSEYAWRWVGIAIGGYLALIALGKVRVVLLPLAVALFVAAVLGPLVERLERVGIPRLAGTWLAFLGSFALLVGLLVLAGGEVAEQVGRIGGAIEEGWRSLQSALEGTPLDIGGSSGALATIERAFRENREAVTAFLVSGLTTVFELATMFLLTLFFSFFLVKDGEHLFETFRRQFDRAGRQRVETIGDTAWRTLTRYLRGLVVIAVFDSVLTAIALLVIGIPLVLPLTLLTFIGSFIPFFGPVVAGAASALVALSEGQPLDALLIVLAELVIQQLEGNVLEPVVMGRAARLHPLVVGGSVAAGAVLAGIPGAFFAVPIVAVATRLYSKRDEFA